MPRDTCLYRNIRGRFLEFRQDRLQLCRYDRCAAGLMCVFANWTDWKLKEMEDKKESGDPWVFVSKRQLRDDLLGIFGEPSIERGIEVLTSLGLLRRRDPERVCGAIWYLFDYPAANAALQGITEEPTPPPRRCPKRRRGYEVSFGNNAEAGGPLRFGNNAEAASAIMPKDASAIMPTKSKPLTKGTVQRGEASLPQPQIQNPTPSEESPTLDLGDSSPEAIVKLCRLRFAALKVKVSRPDVKRMVESLPEGTTDSQVAAAFDAWGQLDYWQGYSHPEWAFRKYLTGEFASEKPVAIPIPANPGPVAASEGPGRMSRSTDPSPIAPRPPEPLPPAVLQWNSGMPEEAQVRYWNGSAPRRELAEAEADPEFTGEFPRLVKECARLWNSGKRVTFHGLFDAPRFQHGLRNWQLILHLQYPFNDQTPAKKSGNDMSWLEKYNPNNPENLRKKGLKPNG